MSGQITRIDLRPRFAALRDGAAGPDLSKRPLDPEDVSVLARVRFF